jgi:tetratricopeptide (TPR) repeat protein
MSIAQDALGLHEEAEKAYDAMPDWWMFRERMNAHKYFNNPDGALRLIEKAIAKGSRDWQYKLRTLTELFRNHNRQCELLQFFQEALYENPNNAEIYKAIGQIHQESAQQDDARAMYEKAVTFQPRDVQAHLALGEIYAKQGFLDEAIKSYRIVLEQELRNLDTYEKLALVYERAGKAEEAAQLAEEFPQHFEEDFQNRRGIFHKVWADIFYAAGQYEKAVAKYQRAIEIEPENEDAKQRLAECYEKLGKRREYENGDTTTTWNN